MAKAIANRKAKIPDHELRDHMLSTLGYPWGEMSDVDLWIRVEGA